jgi:selenocysteine lyase/cysteine desulfurase
MIQYEEPRTEAQGRPEPYPRLVVPDWHSDVRPRLVGDDQQVPLISGEHRRHVNLDYAASTPPLEVVAQAVTALLPWYSSVHRGAGFKSQVSTGEYERARQTIHTFFGARADDTVIFTRNTTEALNLLAHCLPGAGHVLATAVEHHANMLPWRRGQVEYLPVPPSPESLLHTLEQALAAGKGAIGLVAVTGASNVTGEIWPLAEIARIAHRHGARIVVDAAQLAPHAPIDMAALDLDYLAMSGHKLYAPFGAGVLIGRRDWLEAAPPVVHGGGAVQSVTLDDVVWKGVPERHEAGTPNLVGAVALGAACQALAAYGMERLAAEEAALYIYAWQRLAAIDGLELYTVWDHGQPHIGVLTFNLAGFHPGKLAVILSAEHGISVRAGSFCAHPLLQHLMNLSDAEADAASGCGPRVSSTGAVRLSMGLGTTKADVDIVVAALKAIAESGPRGHYEASAATGEYRPVPDTRVWPTLS